MSGRRVCSWICNLMLWAAIVFIITSHASNGLDHLRTGSVTILVIAMIIYYIETFLYSYCSYFLNFASVAKSYEEINKMFKASPSVTMNIVCYHYRQYVKNDGSIATERVDSHKATKRLNYSSWRDISGQFKLDTSGATKDESISYVLLDLSYIIHFADDGTVEDYEESKTSFIRTNKLDTEYEFSETRDISYFQSCFLVQVTDQVPSCFGLGYFILFGLLGFNAPYSTYVDRFCKRQVFTIKKLISTRKDINGSEMESEYASYDPRIIIVNQVIIFPPNQGPQVFALNAVPQQYAHVLQPPPQGLPVFVPQAPVPSQLPEGAASNNQFPQTTQRQLQLDQQQPQPYPGESSPVVSHPLQPRPQESNKQLLSIVPNSQIDPENRV